MSTQASSIAVFLPTGGLSTPHLPQQWRDVGDTVELALRSDQAVARCPQCDQPSKRIHSRYTRTLGDLPAQGRAVRLRLHVRRFFCATTHCPRTIFAERLPKVAEAHARTTARLRDAHREIGFALGGEAGARLAKRLHMSTSPDTLLRRVKQAPLPAAPVPRVLGVDDWAWRKGHRYGTILYDLERQRPVDLLPDREAGTLAAWLKTHPGVEIITRDRAGAFAQGAREGAPNAVQVADRWHLLVNLRDAVERLLNRQRSHLQKAAESVATVPPASPTGETASSVATLGSVPEPPVPRRLNQKELAQQARRQRRRERHDQVLTLHRQGLSAREIGRQMKMSRLTVARWIQAPDFPERAPQHRRLRPHPVDAHLEYIRQRQAEGCGNLKQIAREMAAQGHSISYHQLHRRLGGRRARARQAAGVPLHIPSPRRTSWQVLHPLADVPDGERPFVEALYQSSAEITAGAERAQEFVTMVRQHDPTALENWLIRTQADDVPSELRGFATALRQDQAAIRAALELPWSNGPVEGSINRLKMLKRQMFGRAGIDLLRQRLLHIDR